jgi:uncharacterized protein (DUF58 family)
MPRRDYYDDDDERDPPPRRESIGPAVVLFIVLAVLGLFALGAGALFVARASRTAQAEAGAEAQAAATAAHGVYTRQRFRLLLLDNTPDEVVAAVGKPDSTQDPGDGSPNWSYHQRTRGPVSGEIDGKAQVVFKDGRVTAVDY